MTVTPFGTFFLPGPTEVHPDVLAAMTAPMLPHRGKRFEELFARCQEGLRTLFRTTRPVFVSTSSATGLMEAGILNAPPGAVLALVNGQFSERFANIARACGRETDTLEVPWGETFDMAAVERTLAGRRYAVVTVVHSETSTSALTDVRAVTALARAAGAVCLIDSVTGVGAALLEFDAWDLDYALTGSQKGMALPPGLAFAAASEAFIRGAVSAERRGLYFDLVEFERFAAKHQTPNTPAVSLLFALDVQMQRLQREGMDARWRRHAAMLAMTERWVEETAASTGIPIRMFAPEGRRSPSVSTVLLPEGVSAKELVPAVGRRGFVIGGGLGKLADTTFRIGHMGDHTPDRLALCLDAVGEALVEVGRS
jgi:aspartate aminotransferase-like enzyme